MITFLESCGSTNTYLKENAKHGLEDGHTVIAKQQFSGRGRYGKSFVSPEGGLYLSYLMRPDTLPEETVKITKCAAVAVLDAVRCVCGLQCEIKYVNDLLYEGKKICGILTELSGNNLIIGIGINVNSKIESSDFNAVSVKEISGKNTDLSSLAIKIINNLDEIRLSWPGCIDELETEYEKHLTVK